MWSSRGPQLFLNEAAAVCSQLASLWFISRHVTKWMPLFIHRWKWDWLKNAVRHSVWVVCDVCWMTYAVVTGSWLVNPKRSKSHFLLLVFLFPLVWSLAGISLIRAHAFGAQVNVREDCNWTPPEPPLNRTKWQKRKFVTAMFERNCRLLITLPETLQTFQRGCSCDGEVDPIWKLNPQATPSGCRK